MAAHGGALVLVCACIILNITMCDDVNIHAHVVMMEVSYTRDRKRDIKHGLS